MSLIEWLKVGQRWRDMLDGEAVTITLIEPHVAYPVQYRYESGHLGRDTVEGFIRTNLPLPDLAAFLSASALREGQAGQGQESEPLGSAHGGRETKDPATPPESGKE